MLNLVFLGIQGSGKGTQAALLRDRDGYEHLNIGEMLRDEMKNNTDFGRKIIKYMDAGSLVPDEYIFELVDDYLHKDVQGIVMDGFPRTLKQATYLEERITMNCAVYFTLDDTVAVNRLISRRLCKDCKSNYNLLLKPPKNGVDCDLCGGKLVKRADDHREAIVRRLYLFHQHTKPVVDFYLQKNKIFTINAIDPPEQIHESIINNLKKLNLL